MSAVEGVLVEVTDYESGNVAVMDGRAAFVSVERMTPGGVEVEFCTAGSGGMSKLARHAKALGRAARTVALQVSDMYPGLGEGDVMKSAEDMLVLQLRAGLREGAGADGE